MPRGRIRRGQSDAAASINTHPDRRPPPPGPLRPHISALGRWLPGSVLPSEARLRRAVTPVRLRQKSSASLAGRSLVSLR